MKVRLPLFKLNIKKNDMKEVVINTSGLNSYGSRVLTSGLDITQYCRNPVLLWMHRRGGDSMPIGRMENLSGRRPTYRNAQIRRKRRVCKEDREQMG